MIKIDVEGFEDEVLRGAHAVLAKESLLALVLEDVGLRERFDSSSDIHQRMLDLGFMNYRYEPARRCLVDLQGASNPADGNTLYIRDIDQVEKRLASANPFNVRDRVV